MKLLRDIGPIFKGKDKKNFIKLAVHVNFNNNTLSSSTKIDIFATKQKKSPKTIDNFNFSPYISTLENYTVFQCIDV